MFIVNVVSVSYLQNVSSGKLKENLTYFLVAFKDIRLTLIFKDYIWKKEQNPSLSYTSCLKIFQIFINNNLPSIVVKFVLFSLGHENYMREAKAQSHGTGARTPLFSVTCSPAFLLTLLTHVSCHPISWSQIWEVLESLNTQRTPLAFPVSSNGSSLPWEISHIQQVGGKRVIKIWFLPYRAYSLMRELEIHTPNHSSK